jgi:hypothetical protein
MSTFVYGKAFVAADAQFLAMKQAVGSRTMLRTASLGSAR